MSLPIRVYGFDDETKKMKLLHLFEGNTLEDVQEQSGFPILISEDWTYVEAPTELELDALRALDPDGIVIG